MEQPAHRLTSSRRRTDMSKRVGKKRAGRKKKADHGHKPNQR
ncbi:hypothetical protein [Nocardia seriolae]|nr:hypothetical protein [Nocardia seriolae]WNJ60128.1 hypothetical protein RMO66_04770 [Nocardia seriolae]